MKYRIEISLLFWCLNIQHFVNIFLKMQFFLFREKTKMTCRVAHRPSVLHVFSPRRKVVFFESLKFQVPAVENWFLPAVPPASRERLNPVTGDSWPTFPDLVRGPGSFQSPTPQLLKLLDLVFYGFGLTNQFWCNDWDKPRQNLNTHSSQ